jgi:hypothetical protein
MNDLTKSCSSCGETKSVDEFSKNAKNKDGLYTYCKKCASEKYRRWREANREDRLAYMREWHGDNRERETEYKRERYRNDPDHRQRTLDAGRKYREKNKDAVQERHYARRKAIGFSNDQVRAQTRVSRAVRNGELPPVREQECASCGQQAVHYHHHNGYDREYWLDVTPMCQPCHIKEHSNV